MTSPAPTSTPALRPRVLIPSDVPALLALIDRCYREYELALNLDDECEAHLHNPTAYFRAHRGDIWVIDAPEPSSTSAPAPAIIASGALYLHDAAPASAPVAELKTLYVDSTRRRQGLGRLMTTHVMDAARAAGCRDMLLWSDTRFHAAHRLYESLGFDRFGRRDLQDSNQSSEWGYRRGL